MIRLTRLFSILLFALPLAVLEVRASEPDERDKWVFQDSGQEVDCGREPETCSCDFMQEFCFCSRQPWSAQCLQYPDGTAPPETVPCTAATGAPLALPTPPDRPILAHFRGSAILFNPLNVVKDLLGGAASHVSKVVQAFKAKRQQTLVSQLNSALPQFNAAFLPKEHLSSYDYVIMDKTYLATEVLYKIPSLVQGRIPQNDLKALSEKLLECGDAGHLEVFTSTLVGIELDQTIVFLDVIASVCNRDKVELLVFSLQTKVGFRDCSAFSWEKLQQSIAVLKKWHQLKFALLYGN